MTLLFSVKDFLTIALLLHIIALKLYPLSYPSHCELGPAAGVVTFINTVLACGHFGRYLALRNEKVMGPCGVFFYLLRHTDISSLIQLSIPNSSGVEMEHLKVIPSPLQGNYSVQENKQALLKAPPSRLN